MNSANPIERNIRKPYMVASQTKPNTRCDRGRLISITGYCSVFIIRFAGRPQGILSSALAQCLHLFLAISHPDSSQEALHMTESSFIVKN